MDETKIKQFNEYRQFLFDCLFSLNVDTNDGYEKEAITKQLALLDQYEYEENKSFNDFLRFNHYVFINYYNYSRTSIDKPKIEIKEFDLKLMKYLIENTDICNIENDYNYPMLRRIIYTRITCQEDMKMFNLVLKKTKKETLESEALLNGSTILQEILEGTYKENIKKEYIQSIIESLTNRLSSPEVVVYDGESDNRLIEEIEQKIQELENKKCEKDPQLNSLLGNQLEQFQSKLTTSQQYQPEAGPSMPDTSKPIEKETQEF